MAITKHDGILLVYNLGVTITTGYVVQQLDVTSRAELVLSAFVIALVWTIYFKFAMVERIADHPRFAGDEDDAAAGSSG
ncbi:hypothetical protein [Halopiger xanaduensis]|uniref:DUF8074 domain-containing protein n=1 Tax=Halopiger xanaduensis (strain DSM 18323 / JCM 14033 / SH-6) TaxID=797210 RepID=F8DDA8_HALXS|nr:hypothetical protein [Halopiger xanaduensis]AEH38997.1 hypothetical protein Halxa_0394 [Halopiger xanaduensis SH-6]